jgi:hypothetical protein
VVYPPEPGFVEQILRYDCLFPTIAGRRLRAFTGIRTKNQAACVMLGAKVEHIDQGTRQFIKRAIADSP